VETNITHSGNKNVANYIMGFCVPIAMSATQKVNTHRTYGGVHMHWKILAIEGCSNPNYVQSVVEKTWENNWNDVNIGWLVNQTITPRLKHDKIWTWWTLSILSKSMLNRVWWYKRYEMKFLRWTICCPICWKGEKHAHAGSDRKSHGAFRCC
jgi:hypothetical protein